MSFTLDMTASRRVDAPPAAVWRAFCDMLDMSPQGPPPPQVTLRPLGWRWRVRARVATWRPERQLAWEGSWWGIRLVRGFSFEPVAGGTLVTSREALGGWAVILLRPVFSPRRLGRANQLWLAELAAAVGG